MPTTTFCDVEFTEPVENFRYEKQEYSFSEGDVVSIPHHTANRFVNTWDMAEYAKSPYEIKDEDYDAVLMRVRNKDEDAESDDSEEGVSPQEWLDLRTVDQVESDLEEFGESENDLGFLKGVLSVADRKGVEEAVERKIEDIEEE